LIGIKKGSTILQLETQTFETLQGIQIDMFNPDLAKELPGFTPMILFMKAYQEAFNNDDDEKQFLDKPLIKDLKELKTFFQSNDEELIISNRNSIPELKLKKQDFDKIKQLEDATPDPRNVVVNGVVDILEHSKSKVTLNTNEGKLFGILSDESLQEKAKDFWGKEATIYGVAHFRSNGKLSFIEIERIYEATQDDKYFSKIPFTETTEQQIQKQLKKSPARNWMNELAGKWPGDESDEEFEQLLKDIE
jgi:hypothetical protein